MYVVQNTGMYPIIIRDLNLHISGGKTVDLDSIFKPEMVRVSVDLQKLIERGKLSLLEGEVSESPKKIHVQKIQAVEESKILAELKSDLVEIKDMLRSGRVAQESAEKPTDQCDDDTIKRLTDLQVKNLSDNTESVEKNFDTIGKSTKKSEKLNQLLDVLDSLDDKGE